MQSSRELYQWQIDFEAGEFHAAPAEESEELALIYEAKGVRPDEGEAPGPAAHPGRIPGPGHLGPRGTGHRSRVAGWLGLGGALGLFAIGAAITLMTGRGVLFSGFRQTPLGLAAAAVTFGIDKLVRVSLAG